MKEGIKGFLIGFTMVIVMAVVMISVGKATISDIEEHEPLWITESGKPIHCCRIPIEQFYVLMGVVGVLAVVITVLNRLDPEKKNNNAQ